MKKIFNLLCCVAIMLSTILSSCSKEDSNTNTPTSNPLLCKSYSVYTGSGLNALELSETFEFQYNNQGQVTSKIEKYYENSVAMGAHYFDYTYSGNTIIQNDYFEYNGNKSLLEISYLKLNARNIVISDSNVDATNSSNFRVRKYIYNTNNRFCIAIGLVCQFDFGTCRAFTSANSCSGWSSGLVHTRSIQQ